MPEIKKLFLIFAFILNALFQSLNSMNFIENNATLIVAICLPFTVYNVYDALTSPHPWYLHFIPYRLCTLSIDALQYIKSNMLYYKLRNSQLTNEQQIKSLMKDLKQREDDLRTEEKAIILAMLIQENKKYDAYEKYLKEILDTPLNNKNIKHDEQIDQFTINKTKKILQKYGLNPNDYSILLEIPQSGLSQARVKIDFPHTDRTVSLHFSNNFMNESESNKLSTIAHECTHIKENHLWKTTALTVCLRENNQSKNTPVINRKFEILQEAQANLFPCIKNKKISNAMRNKYKTSSYPGHFYLEHYNELSSINEIHKIINWIQAASEKQTTTTKNILTLTNKSSFP